MRQQHHILSELRELNSSLADGYAVNPFRVPEGYFAGLPQRVLALVSSPAYQSVETELTGMPVTLPFSVPDNYFQDLPEILLRAATSDEASAEKEIEELSPLLSGLRHKNPYRVPEGYFLHGTVSDLNPGTVEEMAALSPLLASIDRKMPYHVPMGYFEELTLPNAVPVVKMGNRKWFRFAAAAAIAGLVATLSMVFITNNSGTTVPVEQTQAWIEKSMKKVSTDEINEFVQLTEEPAVTVTANSRDIQSLMEDVSDREIQRFLAETQAAELDAEDDLIFN